MSFLVAVAAQRNEVLCLVPAAQRHRQNVVYFHVPIVNGYRHAVPVDKGMELSAVLTGEVVPVQNAERIGVAPTVPHRQVVELGAARIGAKAPPFVFHLSAAPRALPGLFVLGLIEKHIFSPVHFCRFIQRRERPSLSVQFPVTLTDAHLPRPSGFASGLYTVCTLLICGVSHTHHIISINGLLLPPSLKKKFGRHVSGNM